jgi:hypothetical protein
MRMEWTAVVFCEGVFLAGDPVVSNLRVRQRGNV